MTTALAAPELLSLLDSVVVAPDGCSAVVDGTALTADDPRQLQAELAAALYGSLHSGQPAASAAMVTRRPDRAFEETLCAAVPHRHNQEPAVVGPAPYDAGGELVVQWSGVRLRVPENLVVGPTGPGSSVLLTLPACRPAVSPGYLVVPGSRSLSRPGPLLRLYVHLSAAEHAATAWSAVLTQLEEDGVAYQAKVLSQRAAYPRRDALVVYLPPPSWNRLTALTRLIAGLPGIGPETPVLARRLGPGVAVAAEPADPRPSHAGMSFGQHRCTVVAAALVAAAGRPGQREQVLAAHFAEAGIDPACPARNTSSTGFPVDDPCGQERR